MPSSPTKLDGASDALTNAAPPGSSGLSRHSREDFPELMAYEAMGGAIVSSVNEFLRTFQSTSDSMLNAKAMTRGDFFPRFYRLANKMTDDCCQNLVQIIRASSVLPSVREAPIPGLAKRIRDTAFKSLDEILASFVGAAKKIETINRNIGTIRDALEKAAAGTPPAATAETAPPAEAVPAGKQKWATEDELARQHHVLLQAQNQAFVRIVQYLNNLPPLPGALLAYACDKCFAGEANFQFEREQVAECQAGIKNLLATALETMARVAGEAKQDVEEERTNILANIELQKAHQVLEKMWQDKMEAKLNEEQRFKRIVKLSFAGLVLIIITILIFFGVLMVRQ
ncbi:MAG: hypothetical protein HYY23_09580 [Verrucomicrobia bacterium]|nr:hypothetical protein [Verrucomicrobiota bacterium]